MDFRNASRFVLLPLAACALHAQEAADPPARVVRLNYLHGAVSYRPDKADDWAPASRNYPLTMGDRLWTDTDGNAELHVGTSAIRLASQAAMSFLNVDDRSVQLSLSQGSMNVRVAHLNAGETFEVDTPHGAVTISSPGDYRIDVSQDGNYSAVTVRSGLVEVAPEAGPGFTIQPGKQSRFAGSETAALETVAAPDPDPWDRWCLNRDNTEDAAVNESAAYVPPDMTGVEDLATNGSWSDSALGAVWTPNNVDPDWTPYSAGHWAFVRPWGWTWVDNQPWGFAPFHYGRWARVGPSWGWYPGSRFGVSIYSPAMVAFLGGDGFGLDISAWVPLGPGEVFRPWYGHSDRYLERVNVNVNLSLVHGAASGAFVNRAHVTAVSKGAFAGGGSVHGSSVKVSAGAASHAHSVNPGVSAPNRPVYSGAKAPPSAVAARPIVAKTAPPRSVASAAPVRVANPNATPVRATPAVNRTPAPTSAKSAAAPAAHSPAAGSPSHLNPSASPSPARSSASSLRPTSTNSGSSVNRTAQSPASTSSAGKWKGASAPSGGSSPAAVHSASKGPSSVRSGPSASSGSPRQVAATPSRSSSASPRSSAPVSQPQSTPRSTPTPRASTPTPRASAPAPRVSTPAPRVSIPHK